jgi:hypothetical protein
MFLFCFASLAGARESNEAKAPVGQHQAGFNPEKHFTIQGIESDLQKEEVKITFSHPLPLAAVRYRLKLLPRVKIDWQRSSMSDQGVLTLRGPFKFGTKNLVILPENFTYGRLTYVKTVNSFYLPDMLPRVEFVDSKSVIERDSRQLLNIRVRNLDNLMLEGIKIPPLLLPLALAFEKSPTDWQQFYSRLKTAADQVTPLIQSTPSSLGFFGSAEPSFKKAMSLFLSQPAEDKQLFSTQTQKNKPQAFSLPLNFRQGKETGAFELIRVKDNQGKAKAVTEPRLFRLTDLGLTYKLGDNSLLLWVTSLKDATPIPGAQILAFTKDLEVFPLGQTDNDGILTFTSKELEGLSLKRLGQFSPVKRQVSQQQIAFLMAGTPTDVSFMEIKPQGDLKPEGVWQIPAGETARSFRGQIFTDRGVYRPGEKINFKGAVREYFQNRIIPPEVSNCSFEITSPKGETVYSQETQLSDFGTAAGELTAQPQWPLGTYTLKMSFGTQEDEGKEAKPEVKKNVDESTEDAAAGPPPNEATCTFMIQEIKPPRHFVEIAFQRFSRPEQGYVNREGVSEFVRIEISSSYYAGGPVKHGQVRWKINKGKTSFQVAGFDAFSFGCPIAEKEELIESGQAILDENGKAQVEFPLDRLVLAGRQGLNVVATVLDFDARAASNTKAFQVEPEVLVGISTHPDKIKAGTEQFLKAVVTQKGQQLKKGLVRAEVLQQSGTYVAKRNDQGDVYWDYQPIWRKMSMSELALEKGEAAFRFDFAYGGEYQISFTYMDEQGRSFTSATSYEVTGDFYWDDYENRDKPYQALAISADRPAYEPGQQAKIMISPRRPVTRYLVTLEQNGILEHRVISGTTGLKTMDLPMPAQYAPNVYLSILGITPRGEFPVFTGRYDSEAPGFFWGNLNLPVRQEVEHLQVKISPNLKELKAEPGTEVELDFTTLSKDGKGVEAEMAVAVVDERVLALTGFKTPTLDQLVKFDRPLGVYTGELRTLLMHQTPYYLAKNEPLTGGGGLEPGAEALFGKMRKRFDPCAYFNPALKTDAQGKAKVSFTLPDTMTTYRVYTVVLDKGSRFASAERPLLATKDFYLEPGMPSFFTQGDHFKFLVSAFNNLAASGPLKFAVVTEGGLKLTAAPPAEQLQGKNSLKVIVSGQAETPGPAQARFGGEFQGKKDAVEESLRINSGYILDTAVSFGSFSKPGEIKLTLPPYLAATDWKQLGFAEFKAVLTVAGSPFLRMSRAINYLLTYPYGCIEQTSSGVLGLTALRAAIRDNLVPGITLTETDKYLTKGIGRILSMQVDSGGFGYWPGNREAHPWGTIYAAVSLGLAKVNGLEVPASALEKVNKYLQEQVKNPKTPASFQAFAVYILALNKNLDPGTFKSLQRDYATLSREAKFLVLLAAKQSNLLPLKYLQAALKPLLSAPDDLTKETAWDDFQARYRGPALALLAAKAILPGDPLTEQAALFLMGGLDNQGIWTSTSDTGWALLSLGEYFKGLSFGTQPVEITIQQPGGDNHLLTLDPKGFRTVALNPAAIIKDPVLRVETPPGQTWLYKVELTAPRTDLAATGAAHGIKVRKTIKNTDGSGEIKVGDLVKVTVFAEILGKDQRYLVLDDPLPAGLVAVNSAFKTEEALPEKDESEDEGPTASEDDQFDYITPEGNIRFRPNFFEIREDRVLAFRDQVYSGHYRFEYYARAVCEGEFILPATKAAAMYSPGVNGYSAKGKFTVKGR